MTKPLVSIAMAVCDVERYLAESIESILGQTFREYEFVIVDFGSIDSTKAIVGHYAAMDSRIKFHEIPKGSVRNSLVRRVFHGRVFGRDGA